MCVACGGGGVEKRERTVRCDDNSHPNLTRESTISLA